jgi:diguanylate cyclase (GGDEF)-like protein
MPSASRHPTSLPGANRALIAVGIMVMLAIPAVTWWLISSRRTEALEESRRASANLAQVLGEQTARSMQTVDLTLREVAADLASTAAHGGESLAAVTSAPTTFALLTDQLKGLPQAAALSIVGADGRVLNFTRGFPPTPIDASDRDFYRHFKEQDDRGVFISQPAKSHSTQQWMVFMARRLNDAQGAFAGVVLAVIPLPYLEDFYRAAMPPDCVVTVLRRDGTILVHYPHNEHEIGAHLPAEAPWYRVVNEGGGSYTSPGYVDGVAYLISVHPMRDFPLVIDVGQTEVAALTGWHQRALWMLAGGGVAMAFAMVLLWAFDEQLRRAKLSEASLARQNAELENSRLQFDAALDNMSQGVTFFDADQKLIVCNRRYREIYRLPPDLTLPGTTLARIVDYRIAIGTLPDMTRDAYMERRRVLAEPGNPFEVIDELRDGRIISLRYQPLRNRGWVTTHDDITERRRAEADLAYLARHDALTRLPNRMLFQERLNQALAMTRRQAGCALLLLDLDGFKAVNDTLGHPVGDGLLQAVAERLLTVVRETDTVARLGGDEFAIIQTSVTSPEQAALLAERAIATLGEPFDLDGNRVHVGASIGVAMAPSDAMDAGALLRNADTALYLAKAEGRGTYRLFETDMDARVQRRRTLELDLRDALASGAFDLEYQPVIDVPTGRTVCLEALIRWNHPVHGVINPVDFIPVAEDTGVIVGIGKWVLRRACLEATAWPVDIGIAVNLSAVQFRGGALLDTVKAALAETGLAPNRLELEITESVLLQNGEDQLATLHRLRALGVRVALDDFGTGYSSLGYLGRFPFDKIKIDRSFVGNLGVNRESKVIVSAVIGLAVGLGMTVTAEGVETAEQLSILRAEGCAQVQGDLFSPPLPAEYALDWIRTQLVCGVRDADQSRQVPVSAPEFG